MGSDPYHRAAFHFSGVSSHRPTHRFWRVPSTPDARRPSKTRISPHRSNNPGRTAKIAVAAHERHPIYTTSSVSLPDPSSSAVLPRTSPSTSGATSIFAGANPLVSISPASRSDGTTMTVSRRPPSQRQAMAPELSGPEDPSSNSTVSLPVPTSRSMWAWPASSQMLTPVHRAGGVRHRRSRDFPTGWPARNPHRCHLPDRRFELRRPVDDREDAFIGRQN